MWWIVAGVVIWMGLNVGVVFMLTRRKREDYNDHL